MVTSLIHNAKIYTPEGIFTWMKIKDNLIAQIGSGNPPDESNKVDMGNNLILPGLIDSHLHVYSLGKVESMLDLRSARSINEIQDKLKKFALNRKDWIIGRNWDQD